MLISKLLFLQFHKGFFNFRYLATGMSFRSLGLTLSMNDYTVGKIVSSVVDTIWKMFYQRQLPVPDHKTLVVIAKGF